MLGLALVGCEGQPDPREVEGALQYAAQAVEKGDARRLFRVIDPRARHAMHSIVGDRQKAAELVERSYPPELREQTLASLGEAARVRDAAGLFAARCEQACLEELERRIGKPERTDERDGELVVHTVRGTELRLYRSEPGSWWGIVWNTDALDAERDKANQDLRAIERNAKIYERRRELEEDVEP